MKFKTKNPDYISCIYCDHKDTDIKELKKNLLSTDKEISNYKEVDSDIFNSTCPSCGTENKVVVMINKVEKEVIFATVR
jgi:transcription elongation factor Elf1